MGLERFYRGKTVFVTGHTGFKGGWLSVWLKALGARVVGYSLPPEHGRKGFFAAARVAQATTSIIGDVADVKRLQKALEAHRPQVLFHLAAQALVLRSYRDPLETFSSNVMGTAAVLECARRVASLRAVVVATSDKCYAQPEQSRPRKEDDPLGGQDPYSASKAAAELVAASYQQSFFSATQTGLATARAGNVIGGGDWAQDRLVPDCIRALTTSKNIVLRHPRSTRPWQHVLEPVFAYLTLAAKLYDEPLRFSQAWNFGPTHARELHTEDVAQLVFKKWGRGDCRIEISRESGAPQEAPALKLDCSKAKKELGLSSRLSVEESVALTVNWYRAQADAGSRFDGLAAALRQIQAYG